MFAGSVWHSILTCLLSAAIAKQALQCCEPRGWGGEAAQKSLTIFAFACL